MDTTHDRPKADQLRLIIQAEQADHPQLGRTFTETDGHGCSFLVQRKWSSPSP